MGAHVVSFATRFGSAAVRDAPRASRSPARSAILAAATERYGRAPSTDRPPRNRWISRTVWSRWQRSHPLRVGGLRPAAAAAGGRPSHLSLGRASACRARTTCWRGLFDEVVVVGVGGGRAARRDAELGEDMAHVARHRLFADDEVLRDPPVGLASGEESKDLQLALGETGQ